MNTRKQSARLFRYGKLAVLIPLLALLIAVGGCSTVEEKQHTAEAVDVTSYNPISLKNYRLGRDYVAAGRYELAREHYLLALASADSPELKTALSNELCAVNLMIKTLR